MNQISDLKAGEVFVIGSLAKDKVFEHLNLIPRKEVSANLGNRGS